MHCLTIQTPCGKKNSTMPPKFLPTGAHPCITLPLTCGKGLWLWLTALPWLSYNILQKGRYSPDSIRVPFQLTLSYSKGHYPGWAWLIRCALSKGILALPEAAEMLSSWPWRRKQWCCELPMEMSCWGPEFHNCKELHTANNPTEHGIRPRAPDENAGCLTHWLHSCETLSK